MPKLSRRAFLTGASAVAIAATVKPLAAADPVRQAINYARAHAIPAMADGSYAFVVHPSLAASIRAEANHFDVVLARYARRFGVAPKLARAEIGTWSGIKIIERDSP